MLKTLEKKLIVVAGPTAVGKTATAISLAGHFQTEIISADSRQFFRELNIGTAKPGDRELAEVPHHFINSLSITEDYDAARFGVDALSVIGKLFQLKNEVIMCGGSGLYIKAATDGFDEIPEIPPQIRDSLINEYNIHGLSWLQNRMQALDPEHFNVIDQQNPHRLMRALEVKIATGISIAAFRKQGKRKHDFEIIKIGLELPREILYERIDRRMDEMIGAGLFQEAEQLYPYKNHNALQTVGYQEIFDYLDHRYDREEAVRLLKRNSRRYAKRQLTWFKRDREMKWFAPGQVAEMIRYIESAN